MHLLAITPLHLEPGEVRRRQLRYQRLAPEGISIEMHNLPGDAPRSLESAQDIAGSEEYVVAELLKLSYDRCDAAIVDCVLDPGVNRRDYPVPVYGMLRLTLALLAGAQESVAAVARNEAIAAELDRKARSYGFTDSWAGCRVLGLPFDAISHSDAWDAAVQTSLSALGGDVSCVINGCSAVDVSPGSPLRVVDPAETALELLGVAVRTAGAGRPVAG